MQGLFLRYPTHPSSLRRHPGAARSAHALRNAGASLVIAAATIGTSWADAPLDRVGVWLGGYAAQVDGHASLEGGEGLFSTGDQRILEGRDIATRARLEVMPFASHGFMLDYFKVHRSETRAITVPFTLAGVTYQDTQLAANTTVELGNMAYRWWQRLPDGKSAVGIGAGAAYYHLRLRIEGNARLFGFPVRAVQTTQTSAWGPLLTLGARTQFNESWRFYADLSGSRKEGDTNSASMVNAALGAEWFPARYLGVGAEYALSRMRYKDVSDGIETRARLDLGGPALYLRLRY